MTIGDGPFRTPLAPESARPSIGALRVRYGVDWARHERWLIATPVLAFALAGAPHGWRTALLTASLGLVAGSIAAVIGRNDRGRVDLHEDGIAIIDAHGASREIAFDDVDLLFVSTSRHWIFTHAAITVHGGGRIVLPGSRYIAPLVQLLVRRCSMPLVGPARAALSNDETLVFGPFALHRSGVTVDGRPKAWSEIGRITFGLTHVTVYDDRGRCWRERELSDVPHAQALATLMGEHTRVEHVLPRLYTRLIRRD